VRGALALHLLLRRYFFQLESMNSCTGDADGRSLESANLLMLDSRQLSAPRHAVTYLQMSTPALPSLVLSRRGLSPAEG